MNRKQALVKLCSVLRRSCGSRVSKETDGPLGRDPPWAGVERTTAVVSNIKHWVIGRLSDRGTEHRPFVAG